MSSDGDDAFGSEATCTAILTRRGSHWRGRGVIAARRSRLSNPGTVATRAQVSSRLVASLGQLRPKRSAARPAFPRTYDGALLAEGRLTGCVAIAWRPQSLTGLALQWVVSAQIGSLCKSRVRPLLERNSFAIAVAALAFETLRFAKTLSVRMRVCDASVMPSTIHAAGCSMVPLYLALAFFFGLTVMQISPAELTVIDTVAAIAGLAAFAICALLFVRIVLTLEELGGQ